MTAIQDAPDTETLEAARRLFAGPCDFVAGSTNVEALSAMARTSNVSIYVKNGSSLAGLGFGGEGYTSFTIASPTGEGLTTAANFTRERRCTMKDAFRFV